MTLEQVMKKITYISSSDGEILITIFTYLLLLMLFLLIARCCFDVELRVCRGGRGGRGCGQHERNDLAAQHGRLRSFTPGELKRK